MKRVLVTGAAGSLGLLVIKYLLSEGKYEVTALDLRNKLTNRQLKRYKKRINIIYGDIADTALMEELVREHDIIIHLASVMPPLGELNKRLGEIVEYSGTENIIKAINYYNSDCFLIYASTTSLTDKEKFSNKDKINEKTLNNYATNKYNTENLIKRKLKNYSIIRLPLILNNVLNDPFMYNIKKSSIVSYVTNVDAAYAFVKAIDYKKEINKKTYNIMSEKPILYDKLLKKILINCGISFKYIIGRVFLEKNFYSPIIVDNDLEQVIDYKYDSLNKYLRRLKRVGKKRYIRKILAKPLIWLKNKE